MPKGVARDPNNDRRRKTKAGGRKPTLPPGTHVWHVRVTMQEREQLAAILARIRQARVTDSEWAAMLARLAEIRQAAQKEQETP